MGFLSYTRVGEAGCRADGGVPTKEVAIGWRTRGSEEAGMFKIQGTDQRLFRKENSGNKGIKQSRET